MQFALRAVGWGIVVYAIMYLIWSGLVIYGLSLGILSLVFRIGTLALVTTFAARSLHLATRMDVLPYSISWAVAAIILDAIFLVPFSGWTLYAEWSVWAGYALVAIIPVLTFSFPWSISSTTAKVTPRPRSEMAYRPRV
ncbi:MAG: hypothetical protein WA021_04900 [Minisyncoccia bacterium]